MRRVLLSIILAACWLLADGERNLLRNPSFEESLEGTWRGGGVKMERHSDDKTHGQVSLLCKDRKKDLSGPSQTLPPLKQGRGYELRADIKLLNKNPEKLFQSFKAIVAFQFDHDDEKETLNGDSDNSKTLPALPAKGKPPNCKGQKGPARKTCLARRRQWKAEIKKRNAEKRRRKEEKKRLKAERRKKKLAQKKKKKERERKNKKKKQKKGKKKKKPRVKNGKGGTPIDTPPGTAIDTPPGEMTGRTIAAESESRQQGKPRLPPRQTVKPRPSQAKPRPSETRKEKPRRSSRQKVKPRLSQRGPRLSRQRRQQKRTRVDPPMRTVLKKGRRLAPTDDQKVDPASGTKLAQGTYIIAWRSWVTPEKGWITLVGSINAPMIPFNSSTLSIRGPDAVCNFLIDNVTLYEIPERVDWLSESLVRIDKHRKSNVSFRVHIPPSVPSAEIDIQVRLKRHLFAFGSKVEDKYLTNRKYQRFQDLVFTLFNWATLGSFKWRFDKGKTLRSPDFSEALAGLKVLLEKGIKVRAHSILWGVKKNIPDAVIATPVDQLQDLVNFHIQYMMNITRGKVAHWDVQNELLHGQWYEETLKNPNFSLNAFREARRLDPTPKLYLNDFTAVTSGANTEDYHDTAVHFIKSNTGIQGLGIQGHTKQYVKPDPTMMWRRLDRLAETGLELFMTEFDVGWDDDLVRADWLEDALRAFFAHPGLGGVILWGFWKDVQRYPNKFLVYGQDLKFAEPGERFACLVKKEWTTNQTFNMAFRRGFGLRAFQGDYEVVVRRNGVPIKRQTFSLGKEGKTVDVSVTESRNPIEVEEERDLVPECISHRDRKSLGELYTTSADPHLTCFDRTAEQSAAYGSRVTVMCLEGSVMIGCSSYQKAGSSSVWRGEEIRVESGVAICSADIVPRSQGGVKVTARCCQQTGLTCDYRQAGPSSPFPGAMAEARCPIGYTAAGCSVSGEHSHISGAFPANNMTSCRAVNGLPLSYLPQYQSGVVSGAVCCKGQMLSCHSVTSLPMSPGKDDVTVTCPEGQVMTACHVKASSGGAAGTTISGGTSCTAHTAADHPQRGKTLVAVAICCRS